MRKIALPFLFAALLAWPRPGITSDYELLDNGGFEDGLQAPWGTGQYAEKGKDGWWNSNGCKAAATADHAVYRTGKTSLHIVNASARSPHIFGSTAQRIQVNPGQRYKITLWAKGKDLASKGAVSIIADSAWNIRPVSLPAGTFDWQKFEGTFELPVKDADIRILVEDKGEAWIDDVSVTPLVDDLY